MANKRDLKKNIRYTCGDIAGECIFAETVFDGIDANKMNAVIVKVAVLQEDAIKKISVSFDKAPRDFKNNMKEYRKARRDYYRECVKGIAKFMRESIESVVTDMNALMPSSQKEAIKKALAE